MVLSPTSFATPGKHTEEVGDAVGVKDVVV